MEAHPPELPITMKQTADPGEGKFYESVYRSIVRIVEETDQ